MNIPDNWCKNVSRSTGWAPKDVRTKVETWRNQGRSLDCIKRILILIALANGRKLCFVSPRGKN